MTEPGVKEPKVYVVWFTEEQCSQNNSTDRQATLKFGIKNSRSSFKTKKMLQIKEAEEEVGRLITFLLQRCQLLFF